MDILTVLTVQNLTKIIKDKVGRNFNCSYCSKRLFNLIIYKTAYITTKKELTKLLTNAIKEQRKE